MEEVLLGRYVVVVSIVYSFIICSILILGLVKKIGLWGIFSKVGEKEWKSIVPFYNQITLLKACKLSPWLILLYIDYLIPAVGYLMGRDVTWAFVIVTIGFICYRFLIAIKLGEGFKKGDAYTFFMALLPSIFYPIVGCSKNESFSGVEKIKSKKKRDTK